ncbi:transcription factor iiic-like protein [Ophiostoma piceae UAMH 11346]|uniref:Transcription factor iiic-like protein n=1 Tax=Ophiostoma piceae (strain UAMH 11346) TaxID=1262450 RepID=S3D231_OPHP1|nr:transcription factor iiic-like protein [Ophiostoma piceae UAMH 11346]
MPPPSLPGRAIKRRRKGAQMTIEDVLTRAKQMRTSSPATSVAASSPERMGAAPATSSPIPISDDSDSDSDLPARRTSRPSKAAGSVDQDEDEDEDDDEDVRPVIRRRQALSKSAESESSEAETDDDDNVRPAKRRQTASKNENSHSDSDDVVVSTPQPKRSRLVRMTPSNKNTVSPGSSPKRSGMRSARSARSEKQRHLELLRRRRMGQKVTESDLESEPSSDEEEATPRVALYDKDPDHVALSDFEDEEEEDDKEDEDAEDDDDGAKKKEEKRRRKADRKREKEKKKAEKKKKKAKKAAEQDGQSSEPLQLRSKFDDDDEDKEDDGYDYGDGQGDEDNGSNDEQDDDMADFIDDTKQGVLGAPDGSDAEDEEAMLRREMPLQFTFQAHKPLKSHFKDAVEWLVHRRLHESTSDGGELAQTFTEADDELYRVAWDRLDREVGGLAQSRFISSVWTPEFYSTLRARPYMDSFNIRPSGGRSGGGAAAARLLLPGSEENICHACGRTNHPASYQVTFGGKAYYSRTLDDVEEDSDEEDGSTDMNGNPIASTSRRWLVGVTCHSNAETAHDLLHWRRALKDWVEEKMQADHLLDDFAKKSRKSRKGREKDQDKAVSDRKEKKREEKKLRKLREFGYKVADDWEANGTINSLFRDFKKMLEAAQTKSTQTSSRFGR